jgi:hypothetical protein
MEIPLGSDGRKSSTSELGASLELQQFLFSLTAPTIVQDEAQVYHIPESVSQL